MKLSPLPWFLGAVLSLAGCSKERPEPASGGNSAEPVATATARASATSGGFAPRLCSVLEKIAPEVRTMAPVGAQAQLVMAIANTFNTDAAALRRVSDEIDVIASTGCPAARKSLLATLKMQSLQEAVR